ncbi:glycoside hydrolase family 108 protein [Kiloniella sp. b19]|uniref:glycoside hydrolase family 108 protein n=1 Tax=Kiloniella sp. GXU_MW_B19 TaxID=3141326 RepID=UPI0031D179D7
MSLKEKILHKILKVEGGYVNDPSDSGGETNFGITIAVARQYGYQGAMKDLPRETACAIYESLYLKPVCFDALARLSENIAYEIADTAVNMGTGRAGEFLQRSLNALNRKQRDFPDLKRDRVIGPSTLSALEAFLKFRGEGGETVLLRTLNALQGAFYVELVERREKDEDFFFGWVSGRVVLPSERLGGHV